jgi:serine phosphatase RsbU (regulator of sigma subunit)
MLDRIKSGWNLLKNAIWQQDATISRRWPIAFWAGAIFCFFIFPLFLIDVGLDSYLTTRKSLQKKEIFKQLNQRLEMLLQYGNSRHYYHALLKKTVEIANKSQDPLAYLSRALPHLKKRNPGVFRFIVWDKNGKTIDRLTDEKSYKYIVRTLYEVFVKASEDAEKNYPGNPSQISLVDKRINLLRSYLGAFFIPERLNLPFLRGILGECILASSKPEKSHFWYQIQNNFGLFANIHIDAIESNTYLKKLIVGLNRNSDHNIRCGIAELIKDRRLFTDKKLPYRRELLIELGKFMHTSESEVETRNQLIVIKPVTPFVLGFTALPTKGRLIDLEEARGKILAGAILIFVLIGSVLSYFLFFSKFFSIRYKLALLFLYANGLPLLILGFLGFEYLQQVQTQLMERAQQKIRNLMTDLDTRFEIIVDRYQREANRHCDQLNHLYEKKQISQEDFSHFEAEILKLSPNDFILADNKGQFRIFRCSGKRADKFIANMGVNILRYANSSNLLPFSFFNDDSVNNRGGQTRAQALMSSTAMVFDEVLQRLKKLGAQQMASEERFYYWNFIGNRLKRKFDYLAMISWPQDYLQEKYLQEHLASFNQNDMGIKFYAMIETNGITYPNEKIPSAIEKLFRRVFNLKVVRDDAVEIDDKNFVAYGSVGKEMNRVALVGIFPFSSINDHILGLRLRLIIFACLSLILTTGIGTLLARQFLEPVKELQQGVKAIGEQNFRYRIPINSADEFGHLGSVFNQAIESLEDLEVAKVVQENLFPLEAMRQNNLEVFGRSVSMTRLGGDYYDYFSIDKNYAGILMGDVAGHGVPAALLMAMAKASVLLADEEQRHSPAALLSSLHQVIFRIKSSKIKRMMTCQYFSINTNDGTFKFANAGHCFPAIIRNNGEKFEQLSLVGTPLGITKRARYKDDEFKLENGDVVILYTDGIIETKNAKGEEMGFDRFEKLVMRSFNHDLETFYQAIFSGYLQWSPSAEDDITMVLFKFLEMGDQP